MPRGMKDAFAFQKTWCNWEKRPGTPRFQDALALIVRILHRLGGFVKGFFMFFTKMHFLPCGYLTKTAGPCYHSPSEQWRSLRRGPKAVRAGVDALFWKGGTSL